MEAVAYPERSRRSLRHDVTCFQTIEGDYVQVWKVDQCNVKERLHVIWDHLRGYVYTTGGDLRIVLRCVYKCCQPAVTTNSS